MMGFRSLARTLLAGAFIAGGVDAWRRSGKLAAPAAKFLEPVRDALPGLPPAEQIVKINAAVQVVGGGLFALGVAPRVVAVAVGATLVPTTLIGHRFWEMDDESDRAQHRMQVLKNAGLIGGLMFAALDTGGRPSIFWSGRKAAEGAVASVSHATHSLLDSVER